MTPGATLLLLLQNVAAPPTADHRTLYAHAAARKASGPSEIDPKQTKAARK